MNPEGDMTGSAMSGRAPLFRGSPVRRVHVMVKPTGARYNLNCTYCYYLPKEQLLGKPESWSISDELLGEFIRQYFDSHNNKEVIFSWQGGEPTLLGLEFFRKVVALPGQCRNCDYQFTCFGECPKNRLIKTAAGEARLNYLCSSWKKFFAHIDEPVQKIVRSLGGTVIKEVRTRAAENWRPERQS
jgi:radical SAM protein with 4Fe4S-binding SPASM domain